MTRQSFCHNADGTPKLTFLSKPEAKRVARRLARQPDHQVEGRVLHLYHCPRSPHGCGYYHIGHDVDGGNAA
jgi:hypothetical protein